MTSNPTMPPVQPADTALHWYVAYVLSCQERKTEAFLAEHGIESFLPVQKKQHKWSDRLKWVDEFLLRGVIFVHCNKLQRVEILKIPGCRIVRFMTEHVNTIMTGTGIQSEAARLKKEKQKNAKKVAQEKKKEKELVQKVLGPVPVIDTTPCHMIRPLVIPDKQMHMFMHMVRQNDMAVTIAHEPLVTGDWVRVIAGDLVGMDFQLIKVEGKQCIGLCLGGVGTFTMNIATEFLEKIPKPE